VDQLLKRDAVRRAHKLSMDVLAALLGCWHCFAVWGAALDGGNAMPPSTGARVEPPR
jgi:hypothetical protein